ncbi:MAG: CopG family ribbon-helix-helix protein [Thermoplasmatota archaeon]
MPVISVSVTEKNLDVIDRMQEIYGLSGRSEAVRACLRTAEDEVRDREGLSGHIEGVLIVVHESHSSPDLDDIRHVYQELITTQIHSHLKNERCLEVFIVNGEAGRIKDMISRFRGKDELDYVKFVKS